jgi:hypothetical protein
MMAVYNAFAANDASAPALFAQIMDEIGVDEIMRLGTTAREKINRAYVEMGPAERAMFHQRHGVGVLVGTRPELKRKGKIQEPVAFTEDAQRRLANHYRRLRHSSGAIEETALLRHNVLAIWAHDGIPQDFLDDLRAHDAADALP